MPKKAQPRKTRYVLRRKLSDPAYTLAEIVHPGIRRTPRRAVAKDEQMAMAAIATAAPTEAQPFLKWVGGNSLLHDQVMNNL